MGALTGICNGRCIKCNSLTEYAYAGEKQGNYCHNCKDFVNIKELNFFEKLVY